MAMNQEPKRLRLEASNYRKQQGDEVTFIANRPSPWFVVDHWMLSQLDDLPKQA
ncbi:hypothetical protein CDV31_003758 [Fusarium ambrosium]|uniref:Uncharacterized protein n=1 Tax=Fusarium ambrosium TaxID=131363 RepID=A0A428UST0_9HYPO|nr:hypothetical protein CDV31_003758 [Fusarium ambrosium]